MRNRLTGLIQPLTVLTFGIFFWLSQAVYGLALTDDGEVLAMAWRVANGEVPHSDFYSIRPAGFSYLHAPFTLFDSGMLAFDRLFVVLQLLAISYFSLSALIQKQSQLFHLIPILTITSFVLNVNTWPILAWHTIDGLFLASLSLYLASRQTKYLLHRNILFALTWFIAGFTVLMKQGFLLFLVILGVYFFGIGMKRALLFAPAALIPIVTYFWLTRDANPPVLTQISIGSSSLIEFLIPIGVFLFEFKDPVFVTFFFLSLLCTFLATRTLRSDAYYSKIFMGIQFLSPFALILWIGAIQDFSMSDGWIHIAIVNSAIILLVFRTSREQIWMLVSILCLAYLISISRGVPSPSLLAGSFFVAAFARSISVYSEKNQPTKVIIGAVLAIILSITTFSLTSLARSNDIYQEGPRETINFGVSIPTLKYIKMSERSAKYLNIVSDCLDKYPASQVAILPDGPGIYPIFKLENPFSNDWFYNLELDPTGSGEGILVHDKNLTGVISKLNRSNSWLILNQSRTFSEYTVENVNNPGEHFYYSEVDKRIFLELEGLPVVCGSLTGLYKP